MTHNSILYVSVMLIKKEESCFKSTAGPKENMQKFLKGHTEAFQQKPSNAFEGGERSQGT